MKLLLDASVIIAAFVKVHPHHIQSAKWFQKAINHEYELYISDRRLA